MGLINFIGAGNRTLKFAASLVCVAFLGGCGGVELEGKVFDYAGLSGSRQKADPTMTSRAPLMVPPNLQSLPAPTESRSVAAARQDWPDDPEKVRVRVLEEEKKVKAAEARTSDPLHAYAGKETLLDKVFKPKNTMEVPVADVPEPDASDRIPGSAVAARPRAQAPHVPQAPLPDQNNEDFTPATPKTYGDITSGQNAAY